MIRARARASLAAERLLDADNLWAIRMLMVKHYMNPPRDASGGTKRVPMGTKLNKKAFGKAELRQKPLENFFGATRPRAGGSSHPELVSPHWKNGAQGGPGGNRSLLLLPFIHPGATVEGGQGWVQGIAAGMPHLGRVLDLCMPSGGSGESERIQTFQT